VAAALPSPSSSGSYKKSAMGEWEREVVLPSEEEDEGD
jgi:hypothetical protein